MAARSWTCQRVSGGVKCGHVNALRKLNCEACGKRRPPTKRPAHMAALKEYDYVWYVAQFGERCGICGSPPKSRRLDRDHEHKGDGKPRGLLCAFPCNTGLKDWMTPEWLEAAAAYLRRAEGVADEIACATYPGCSQSCVAFGCARKQAAEAHGQSEPQNAVPASDRP